MSDPYGSQFAAIIVGSGIGVVAGVMVQYGFQMLLDRHQKSRQLADIRAEAFYNSLVLLEIIEEVRRFRSSCQPDIIAGYIGIPRFQDILWIAMGHMVSSGGLYRTFENTDIQRIQKCMSFLSMAQGQSIMNQIGQIKQAADIGGGIKFANFLEYECKTQIATLKFLMYYRVTWVSSRLASRQARHNIGELGRS